MNPEIRPPASPDPDWTLRPLRPGDEAPVAELFERAFARPFDPAHWRWKLGYSSSPVENVWLAVDRGGRPVFHYGGIPCRVDLPGGSRRAMVSVDAMTDPAYQRRGVLTSCATAVFESWRAAGIDLTLGLPNERYGSRTQALGWRPLFPLAWRIRPLNLERILARRLRLPGLSLLSPLSDLWNHAWDLPGRRDPSIEIDVVEDAGEEFDAFEEARRGEVEISIARGSRWLRWRYLSHPSRGYRLIAARRSGRLAGYLAYRLDDAGEDRVGYVAELVSPRDRAASKALLAAALAKSRAAGAIAVLSLAVPGTDLHRTFRRAGFVLTRGAFMVHCVPFIPDLDLEALRDPRRFQVQGGDFDVI